MERREVLRKNLEFRLEYEETAKHHHSKQA